MFSCCVFVCLTLVLFFAPNNILLKNTHFLSPKVPTQENLQTIKGTKCDVKALRIIYIRFSKTFLTQNEYMNSILSTYHIKLMWQLINKNLLTKRWFITQYNFSIISGLRTTFNFITYFTAISVKLKLLGNLDKTEQTQQIAHNTSRGENITVSVYTKV